MILRALVSATAATLIAASGAWARDLTGVVTLEGEPVGDIAVYVEDATGGPKDHPHTMNQQNLAFEPPVLPVLQGTTVEFTNADAICHSVMATKGTDTFDLGLKVTGAKSTHRFDNPGPVLVQCQVHKHMKGYILVLKNGYFTNTDDKGRFTLHNVPDASVRVTAWSSPTKSLTKTEAGTSLDFAL